MKNESGEGDRSDEGRLLPASRDLAGSNTTVLGLIVSDPTDKLARRANGMGACGTPEDEMSEIIKKHLETEKKTV